MGQSVRIDWATEHQWNVDMAAKKTGKRKAVIPSWKKDSAFEKALHEMWPDDPIRRAKARRIARANSDPEHKFREGLKSMTKMFGREDPATLRTWHEFVRALEQKRKYAEAESEYRKLIPIEEKILGLKHFDTFQSWSGLAFVLARQRRYREAESWAHRTVEHVRTESQGFWYRRYASFLRNVRKRIAGLPARIERP